MSTLKSKVVREINRAYKFRLYPNAAQRELIAKTFGCTRFIYNQMLADKIKHYNNTQEKLYNTPAMYKAQFEWLKEVDSLALANSQLHLQRAYDNFFRDQTVGFPRFKSKRKTKKAYTTNYVNGNIYLAGSKIKLPKLGPVKLRVHRQIPPDQTIKSCTVSQSASGKYYVSILTQYDVDIPAAVIDPQNVLGLDMDMQNLFTDNNGIRADYPRYYRQMQNQLALHQRRLSRCVYQSNNYYKQRSKVSRLQEKIANQRRDFLHKLSCQIANDYDAVCIENLNMKAMSQCLKLGKSVMDNGWGLFSSFLDYKLKDRGKPLVKVDKWYPSSKTCSICGRINQSLTLGDRLWTCDGCKTCHDRDVNAAINIKTEGLRLILA